jgi:hypothetical protein
MATNKSQPKTWEATLREMIGPSWDDDQSSYNADPKAEHERKKRLEIEGKKAEKRAADAAARRQKREEEKRARIFHERLCDLIKKKQLRVTEEYLKSVTDPKMKQELVEAICLSKV